MTKKYRVIATTTTFVNADTIDENTKAINELDKKLIKIMVNLGIE